MGEFWTQAPPREIDRAALLRKLQEVQPTGEGVLRPVDLVVVGFDPGLHAYKVYVVFEGPLGRYGQEFPFSEVFLADVLRPLPAPPAQ